MMKKLFLIMMTVFVMTESTFSNHGNNEADFIYLRKLINGHVYTSRQYNTCGMRVTYNPVAGIVQLTATQDTTDPVPCGSEGEKLIYKCEPSVNECMIKIPNGKYHLLLHVMPGMQFVTSIHDQKCNTVEMTTWYYK